MAVLQLSIKKLLLLFWKRVVLTVYLLALFQISFAQLSTEGREFWVGFMEIIPNQPPVQKLYITSKVNTTVTVTMGSPSSPTVIANNQPITANQITTISLPSTAQATGSETKQTIGVRVTSPDFISVFASNESNARSEASVVIPVNSLGGNTEYIVAAYQGSSVGTSGGTPRSEFLIVALEDNTVVNITPTAATRGGRPANVVFSTPTLNRGDVYQVQASSVTADLTGTRLVASGSCKPFAVFAGANATLTNNSCNAWEHLYEQLTPIQTWGRDYLVTPFKFASQGYSYRIIAKDNNTVVSINGTPTYTLNSGQVQEVQVPNEAAFCVQADKPICVAQYKKGQDCNGFPPAGSTRLGDPALLILNPLNQTIKDISFFTFPLQGGAIARYFVNIVTRTASIARIKLNGVPISPTSFTASPCGNYSYASIEISNSNHRLSSDSSFIAYAYGYGQAEGFAYSVGGAFENQEYNFHLPATACVGQTINLQGTGNVLGFSWNFGNGQTATGQNVSVTYTSPGFYEVTMTVTISGGCGTDFVRKTIEILPYPTVNLGPNRAICPNTTTTLSAGTQPAGTTYLWSNGATTPTITVGAGTYTVTVTNRANCSTTSNPVTISFHPVTSVTTNVQAEYCTNSPAFSMSGTPAGGSFTINGTPATQFDPSALGAGTFTVVYTAQDANNCTVSSTQTVTIKPAANLTSNLNTAGYCVNAQAVTLQGTPAGGSFTINGNPATQFNPSVLGVGTHTVVYTYNNPNGCISTLQQNIQVFPKPNPVIVGATSVCVETVQTYSVASVAGNTYQWQVTDAVGTILSGQGTHQITVRWDAPLSNAGLQITQTNSNNCAETATIAIVVNPKPTVQITNLNPSYCINTPAFNLTATPVGGTFTINGNSANQFNASALGVGNHTVVYSFTDNNGCTNTDTKTVQIFPLPVLTINGLANRYCIDNAPINLTATPVGGSFTINGNAATQFNPNVLGVGTHIVRYTFTDTNNCTNTLEQSVEVVPLPTLAFVGLQNHYCIDVPAFVLSATPAGGTFRINGNVATQFNPSALGVGTHTVRYEFTDNNNCRNTIERSVVVNPLPTPSIVGLAPIYCLNSGIIQLVGSPAGGVFRINGNVATHLNPSILGIGNHTVTYTYTDANGCTKQVSQNISIEEPRADVQITGLGFTYCINANPFELTATPAGGVFTINGNVVTHVKPSELGVGVKTVFYTYTDPRTNCSVTVSKDFEISSLPSISIVNISGLNNQYCLNAPPFNLIANPAGGVFTINGVVKTQLNPAELGPGRHVIIYNYQDINGCTNTDSKVITIPELPNVTLALKEAYCTQNPAITLQVSPPNAGSFTINGLPATVFNPQALGVGEFIVRFVDPTGCVDLSKKVKIKAPPEPTKYENLRICSNSEDTLRLTATEGKRYRWNTGDTTRTIAIRKSGRYTIRVIDELECFSESTIDVIDECFPGIYVPTAFTPNGDGLNDKLEIFGRHFDKFETWIFNKWGEVVFRSNDRYVNWDGTYLGKEAPPDVYVCKIRFRYLPNSPMLERVFSVTLIR
ncbi:MAG: gliding motility-associated C-terminal domain-containing protein [Microscillaceae bacterium]|nr:gliding motility-associated C-terminal domain-containing protein [Microscillaceae bacterium]MDW8461670.1 gliding motility-associated C-terminal domain-containing protein [Cytophagales bacterium]